MSEALWRKLGKCSDKDPNLFFPQKAEGINQAKAVCEGCSVLDHCLEEALTEDIQIGIRGGMSEKERRAFKKQRRSQDMGLEMTGLSL